VVSNLSATADFNARDHSGNVLALIERLSAAGEAGDLVNVRDAEGNRAIGRIVLIAEGLVHIDIDWDTWVAWGDAPDESPVVRLAQSGGGVFVSFVVHVRRAEMDDLYETLLASTCAGATSVPAKIGR
jgi:hypothetical protein